MVVLRNQNIKGGRLDLSSPSFTDEEHYQGRVRRAAPQAGDIVMTREAPMGDVCQIPRGLRCCVGQRQVLLRPDPMKVDGRFLLFALQSPYLQHQIGWNEGTGSTVSNLRIPVLEALRVPTPTLPVQREIAETLGAIDDRIALLRETNATLEAIAQALFKSWFVDFDPVHAKSQGLAPAGMDEATASLFPDSFQESALGLVPKGWSAAALGELLELTKGCSYKGDGLSESEGAHMFNLGCFNAHRVFATAKVKRYTGEFKPRHEVVAGDLIIANTDMTQTRDILGRPVFVPDGFSPGFISHHVFKVTVKAADPEKAEAVRIFLFHALQQDSFRDRAIGFATGTTVLALPAAAVEGSPFYLAPESLLDAFAKVIRPMLARVRENERLSARLSELRDTLLPRLISGQLRLPEASATIASHA